MILWILILFAAATPAFSADEAIEFYNQGKFADALAAFQRTELRSAKDFYNVGNCYFKLQKFGQAVAYFRKAHELAPWHADITFNLERTETLLEEQGGMPKDLSWWRGKLAPRFLVMREEIILSVMLLAGAVFFYWVLRKNRQGCFFWGTLWAMVGLVFVAQIAAKSILFASILADTSIARSGPSDSFTDLFHLPAGTRIELTGERQNGWTQIRFSTENLGWVPDKEVLAL